MNKTHFRHVKDLDKIKFVTPGCVTSLSRQLITTNSDLNS